MMWLRSGRRRVWLVAVVVLAVVAGGCAGGGGSSGGPVGPEPVEPGGGVGATVGPEPVVSEFVKWYPGLGRLDAPGGVFVDIAVSTLASCGVRVGGELVCWGEESAESAWWWRVVRGAPVQWEFSQVELWSSEGDDDYGVRPNDWPWYTGYIGGEHACGLRFDGVVVCWGQEFLGLGDAVAVAVDDGGYPLVWELRSSPDQPGEGFVDIAAGPAGVCGLRGDGSVACWGGRRWADVGVPGGLSGLVVGDGQVCGVRSGAGFGCWARLVSGEGSDLLGGVGAWQLEGSFVDVAAPGGLGCGLRPGGEAVCTSLRHSQAGWVEQPLGELFSQLTVGAGRTNQACGIRGDGDEGGEVVCWGDNFRGKADPPAGEFVQVAAGSDNTCGVRVDGEVVCWGDRSPAPFLGDLFTQVAVGNRFVCGLRLDGAVACRGSRWGHVLAPDADPDGAVGAGPSDPASGAGLVEVSAYGDMVCGLGADGVAVCWFPQWDRGPVEVPGGRYVSVSVSSLYGDGVVCGLGADGAVGCWRYVADVPGWVGGVQDQEAAPGWRYVADVPGWVGMAVPAAGFAALDARGPCGIVAKTGEVACWEHAVSPQQPADAGPLAAASVGGSHGCGVGSADGSLMCWHTYTQQPLDLGEGFDGEFSDVAVGPNGSGCAIRADHTLGCWGDFAALNNAPSTGPIAPPGGEFTQVAVARHHACAIRAGGDAVCWGHDHDGEYGHTRYIGWYEDDWMPTPLE
ncbi:RCC1 domain-containing protein [Candidatus Poriferisocius sp.]|uniref:RCC1 domain-containing protein n=1 Tax=Candidatus Poriferisocius sp. TaxID=3101276 RepID=UPI003B0265FB